MTDLLPKTLQDLADCFHTLPGIGKKTALRYAIQLLNQDEAFLNTFAEKIKDLNIKVGKCTVCCNISEHDVCGICSDGQRDDETVCVVEDIRDVIAIEQTHQYKGKYHVLGGVISPIDGIGPNDLSIDVLINRVKNNLAIKEIILALSTTMEGDTTNFYLHKKLRMYKVKLSVIARGISFGGQIEYVDELTLGKSIHNRTPYQEDNI